MNQLSKQNASAPRNKTSSTKSTQTELITDSKLTESSKKSGNSNRKRERVKNEKKNKSHIDPQQSTPLCKNADDASTKETAENSEDNSSINPLFTGLFQTFTLLMGVRWTPNLFFHTYFNT